ncbi:MAG: class I SAM-dependent methyltransferase [Actinobacteria bacterium]|nr:class I SAM-dependent methyltransferase [Actinomycetota bacterium]
MSKVEEKLAKSLSAETTELIPHLPYLLQDLWELGSIPKDIAELISIHLPVPKKTKVLDLACGKGAVSIYLAKTFSCHIKGIDIISEFISYAKKKAAKYSVEDLCEFEVEDINNSVKIERKYDIVILGSVGDVLGNSVETILKLKSTVNAKGYIFIDDAYSSYGFDERYPSRQRWIQVFKNVGVKLIAEKTIDDEELIYINRFNQGHIIKRANELKIKYPEKSGLFEGYIQSQQREIDELEGETTGIIWLLQTI